MPFLCYIGVKLCLCWVGFVSGLIFIFFVCMSLFCMFGSFAYRMFLIVISFVPFAVFPSGATDSGTTD